jgi:hypothetical protein
MRLAKHVALAEAPTSWTSYLELFFYRVPRVARAKCPASYKHGLRWLVF